jgi:hypothetical protein
VNGEPSQSKNHRRDGNVLSAVIRQAWESGDLRILTKNDPARATGAHISIIGHISAQELRAELTSTDKANGFANRFGWLCVQRSKYLPDGGRLDEETQQNLEALVRELSDAVAFAKGVDELRRDEAANALWHEAYPKLSDGSPGLVGAMTARAEAQVMRFAAIYALLDRAAIIRVEHLRAALALWEYLEASVRFIFRDSLGDPVADRILEALRGAAAGLTRTEIRDLLSKHGSAEAVDRALSLLAEGGLARSQRQPTDGRPVERWFAIVPAAAVSGKGKGGG